MSDDHSPFRTMNILVAEDNPVNQQVISGILRAFDHTVDIAENGIEAVRLYSEHSYDLVFMDIQMPEMDGYQAAEKIRATGSRIPIIAITAHNLEEDRLRCLEYGMDDYLTKPISPDALLRIIGVYAGVASAKTENGAGKSRKAPSTPFSYRELTERALGDETLILDLLNNFLAETPSQLASLREAARREEWDTVHRLLHRLRGAAGTLSAVRMQKLLEEARLLCTDGDGLSGPERLTAVTALLGKLDEEFEIFREAADRTVGNGRNNPGPGI